MEIGEKQATWRVSVTYRPVQAMRHQCNIIQQSSAVTLHMRWWYLSILLMVVLGTVSTTSAARKDFDHQPAGRLLGRLPGEAGGGSGVQSGQSADPHRRA